jgi:hypothetical protein
MDVLAIGAATGGGGLSLAAAVALGGVALLVGFAGPRKAALLALALGMLQYGPTKALHVVPLSFTVIDDILLLGLGIRWLADVSLRRTTPPLWATTWLLVWMAFGLLDTVAYGISIATTLESFRWMFLPAVLYVVSAQHGRERGFARSLIRIVVAVGLLQAAVAIAQAFNARSIGDGSFGLLGQGGANALGFLILLTVVLVAADGGSLSRSVWPIALGIAGIVASSARAAIIVLPFALILAYRGRLRRPAAALALVAIVTASGYVVVLAFERSQMNVRQDLSPARLVVAQLDTPNHGGGRLLPLLRLPTLFGTSPLVWATGLGPGQYGSAFRQIPSMRNFSYSIANSEWVVILGEYGLVGVLCFLAILVRPLRLAIGESRPRDGIPWALQISRAAPSIILIAVVGMTVLTILEYQPFSYPWWALLGLLEAASPGSAVAASNLPESQSAVQSTPTTGQTGDVDEDGQVAMVLPGDMRSAEQRNAHRRTE